MCWRNGSRHRLVLRSLNYINETIERPVTKHSANDRLQLCRWMLLGMDGIEVMRSHRTASQTVPVLIFTVRDAIDDRVLGLDVGADDYLVNPFAFAKLLTRPPGTAPSRAAVTEDFAACGE